MLHNSPPKLHKSLYYKNLQKIRLFKMHHKMLHKSISRYAYDAPAILLSPQEAVGYDRFSWRTLFRIPHSDISGHNGTEAVGCLRSNKNRGLIGKYASMLRFFIFSACQKCCFVVYSPQIKFHALESRGILSGIKSN